MGVIQLSVPRDDVPARTGATARTAVNGNAGKPTGRHVLRGIACAIVGGSMWGFSGSCAQFLLTGYAISPLFITAVRMTCAGLIFVGYLLIRERKRLAQLSGDRHALLGLAVFGIGGLYLSQLTYTIVIGFTNAGTATVLQSTSTIFVMLAACVAARRPPRPAEAVGLALACGATWLIATNADPSTVVLPVEGLLWGLANGLAVAFYIVYPRRLLDRYGSVVVTGCGMLMGGIVACLVALPQVTPPSLDLAGIGAFAAIILLGTCAAFGLYLQGVADAGPVRASMLGVSEPIAATLVSWLWLGTSFSAADLVGFAMMIAMVIIIAKARG